MMSTGSLPLAGLPHHVGQNFENTDTDPCCNHVQHDQNYPGDNRDTLKSAPGGLCRVRQPHRQLVEYRVAIMTNRLEPLVHRGPPWAPQA